MEIKELTAKMNEFVSAMGWYASNQPKTANPAQPGHLVIS